MTSLEDRNDYLKNPFYKPYKLGDFTTFYVAITICSVIGGLLFILNIAFCWCSRHRNYWKDRNTGNRWIQSMWVVTPHKNPPLDLSELGSNKLFVKQEGLSEKPNYRDDESQQEVQYYDPESYPQSYPAARTTPQPQEYLELQKRESEI